MKMKPKKHGSPKEYFFRILGFLLVSFIGISILVSGGSVIIRNGGLNASGILYVDSATGRVGIGTASPTTKLDVAGTVNATAFKGDGSQLTGVGSSHWTASGSNVYYNTGNVGIGTANPESKLHIGANSSFDMDYTSGGEQKSRKLLYSYRKADDIDYVRINLSVQGGFWDLGGGVRVKVIWVGPYATSSTYQEYVFAVSTSHSATNNLAISPVNRIVNVISPSSYYGYTSIPDVDWYVDGIGNGMVLKIKGKSNYYDNPGYPTRMLISAEIDGHFITEPAISYIGTALPAGAVQLAEY